MNTLCDDVLSFDAILGRLTIRDVCALACASRALHRTVTDSCRTSRWVGVVHNRDVHHVLDRERFSSLETMQQFVIDGRVQAHEVRGLLARWPVWSTCMVHTSRHSRRALKVFLARVEKIRRLTVVVDNRPNRAYVVSLRNAVHACRRRNSATLHDIALHTSDPPPRSLLIAMGALRHVTLEWAIVCTDEVYFAVTALSRQNIRALRICNSSVVRPCGHSSFLRLLLQWEGLHTLDLRGPIVNPFSDRSLDVFCRDSALKALAIDLLCPEHVAMLECGGLKTLDTRVAERVTQAWLDRLPSGYTVVRVPAPVC